MMPIVRSDGNMKIEDTRSNQMSFDRKLLYFPSSQVPIFEISLGLCLSTYGVHEW